MYRPAGPAADFPPPPWIGTDEAGKGDYFGPLVVAAVYSDKDIASSLKALGVRDSKMVADRKARELAMSVRQICREKIAVIELTPVSYNALYERFREEKKNLNHLLAWAHAKAIETVLDLIPCPTAITDQFADARYLRERLRVEMRTPPLDLIQRPRAEENIAVAAASLLARAAFLDWLEKAGKRWGTTLPKGATHVIEAARSFARANGKKALQEVAKLHFRTTEKALQEGM